ncbi:MAG TPA: DUF4397 domain-containing protein [Longimicrobiales bacterium]|nr:DUF4397 domain-containing protein [Longimicrobiales bacterium]
MRAQSLLPLVLIVSLIACDDDDPTGPLAGGSTTQIRIVHASPQAPIMNAVLRGVVVAERLHYLDVSDYVGVEPDEHLFAFWQSGAPVQLGRTFLSVEPDQRYTILAVDSFPAVLQVNGAVVIQRRIGVAPLTLLDDPTAPPAGSARLRFVAAAPSTLVADVYITAPNANINSATPTFREMRFSSVATYITLAAGQYRVRVTSADTKTVLLDVNPFPLSAGQVQTAVMLDGPAGGAPAILMRLVEKP